MSKEDDSFKLEKVALSVANLFSGGTIHDLAHVFSALGLETAAARMDKAIAIDHAEWMEERVIALEKGYDDLRAKGVDVKPTDARPIAEAIDRAFRKTADPNKRRLLELAATRAFDPELYGQGLTLVLLEKLERLTYGDVTTLRWIAERQVAKETWYAAEQAAEAAARRDGLRKKPLPVPPPYKAGDDGTLRAFQEGNLASEALIISRGGGAWPTELGRRMLALLSETPKEGETQPG